MERVATAMPVDAMRTRILLADAALQLGYVWQAGEHVEQAELIGRDVLDAGVLTDELAAARSAPSSTWRKTRSRRTSEASTVRWTCPPGRMR